jgi:hypothetical protein
MKEKLSPENSGEKMQACRLIYVPELPLVGFHSPLVTIGSVTNRLSPKMLTRYGLMGQITYLSHVFDVVGGSVNDEIVGDARYI